MNSYLVYLNWPEACFAANEGDLADLRARVPAGARVVSVADDAAFLRALPAATHVVTWYFRPEWFALAPNLRVLATPGAGRELVPPQERAPAGVRVHFGGFHGSVMAESVAGFMLAWAHGFFCPEAHGPWGRIPMGNWCYAVAGTKAVVIGYGRVGRAIGAKLEALGVSVWGYARRLGFPKEELARRLSEADWVVMALPSDTGTDNFLDAERLAQLPARCVVVNVGRGNSVDEPALLAALEGGRLAGAYLDVFRGEPGAWSARFAEPYLLARERLPWNLVKMPHTCAFCRDYVRQCFAELERDGCLA